MCIYYYCVFFRKIYNESWHKTVNKEDCDCHLLGWLHSDLHTGSLGESRRFHICAKHKATPWRGE